MLENAWDRRQLLAAAGALAIPKQETANEAILDTPAPGGGIWDIHVHLTDGSMPTPEARMERLLQFADRMGIERLVLSLGVPLLEDPPPEQFRDVNNQVLRVLRRWPGRALGFVYLNPNHVASSCEEFDRCVRDGPMIGVKLWVAKRCSARELDPIVERAVAARAVIYQHTWFNRLGNLPGESTPYDVAALAVRHPEARIICGHTGGDWELGIRAVRSARNASACIAGSHPTAGFIEMAVRELGAERVIYGSDAPGRSFASQLGKVLGAAISARDKTLILGGNLKRLLAPILEAKGVRV
jgi:predicted TIM-barrel fold metal-dependent hydrolase